MLAKDIKKDTIIYSAPYKTWNKVDEVDKNDCFQIYNIHHVCNHKITTELDLDVVIGPYSFNLELDSLTELDDLFLIAHGPLFMVYSTNEKKIIEYYQNYINQNVPTFEKIWDEQILSWVNGQDYFSNQDIF